MASGGGALLAAMSAAASPVAGVLLALAALSESLWRRSPRTLLVLGLPALVVALALGGLFPEGGSEPYPTISFLATVAVVAAFAVALPREQGRLRLAAGVYLLACVFFLLVSTPMGSNVERYGVLLAGPLLICAVASSRSRRPLDSSLALPALAFALWAVWAGWGPVRETLAVAGSPATNGAYYAPVERYLDAHARGPVRIEVPLTRTHWETAELAPRVSLARGWEKQLDERYNGVLLSPELNAASYERWLHEQAVSYVALPAVQLDPSSAREGKLIRAGLPYLRARLLQPPLAHLRRARADAARLRPRARDLARARLALAAGRGAGQPARARALDALLDRHEWCRLRAAWRRRLDARRRCAARAFAAACELLAWACFRGWALLPVGLAGAGCGWRGAKRVEPRQSRQINILAVRDHGVEGPGVELEGHPSRSRCRARTCGACRGRRSRPCARRSSASPRSCRGRCTPTRRGPCAR